MSLALEQALSSNLGNNLGILTDYSFKSNLAITEDMPGGYYLIREKIAGTKHIVKIEDKINNPRVVYQRQAQFFGTKRELLSDLAKHYILLERLPLELEDKTSAVRST